MRVLKLIKTEAVLVVLFASVVLFGGCGHATQASGDPDNSNSAGLVRRSFLEREADYSSRGHGIRCDTQSKDFDSGEPVRRFFSGGARIVSGDR